MSNTYTYRAVPVNQRPFMVSKGWEETPKFLFNNVCVMFQVFRKERKSNISH